MKVSASKPNPKVAELKHELQVVEAKEKKADALFAQLEKEVPSEKPQLAKLQKQVDHRYSLERAGIEAKLQKLEHPSHPPAHPPAHQPPTTHLPGDNSGLIKGGDFSHYQSTATFNAATKNARFAALKATEGTSYTDPTFRSRWNALGNKIKAGTMKLRVAYHFLQPGNGVGQAKHFLNTLGIHGKLQPGTRLALDWEASALSSPSTLRDAANYIHHVTGTWPLIYTSASQVSRAKAAAPQAPIWEAQWGSMPKDKNQFVQTSDGPGYDHDVFRGTLAQLEHFAGWN